MWASVIDEVGSIETFGHLLFIWTTHICQLCISLLYLTFTLPLVQRKSESSKVDFALQSLSNTWLAFSWNLKQAQSCLPTFFKQMLFWVGYQHKLQKHRTQRNIIASEYHLLLWNLNTLQYNAWAYHPLNWHPDTFVIFCIGSEHSNYNQVLPETVCQALRNFVLNSCPSAECSLQRSAGLQRITVWLMSFVSWFQFM